jgi:hypothetical protein
LFTLDLATIIRIARRRWKIVLPILLLTLGVAAKIYTDKSTNYWVTGTELLVAGRGQSGDPEYTAGVAAALIDDLLGQPSIQRQLLADGLSDSYTLDLSETGTTLELEIIGESPEQAVDTAARLIDIAPGLLEESLGERAAQTVAIELATAASPEDATAVGDGTYRYSTVVVVGNAQRVTVNPFPPSLATVRSLSAVAESLPFLLEVGQISSEATFEVSSEVREAPMIDITVWASTPEEALQVHEFIVDELHRQLDEFQASSQIEAPARTQMLPLVDASYAVPTPTSRVRPMAAVVVLGSGLAIGLATVAEALAADRRRRRRREEWSVPDRDSAPDEPISPLSTTSSVPDVVDDPIGREEVFAASGRARDKRH